MPKQTPNKYFVGQLDRPKRGLPYRIFRQRKSMLGTIIDEVCLKTGWKRMKTGYKRVGPFLRARRKSGPISGSGKARPPANPPLWPATSALSN